MVPEPGSPHEDQDDEGREREARERLMETKSDGPAFSAPWRPDGSLRAANENASPSPSRPCKTRGWAPEPLAPSTSATGGAPPSQAFSHRGGRESPALASEPDPPPKAR